MLMNLYIYPALHFLPVNLVLVIVIEALAYLLLHRMKPKMSPTIECALDDVKDIDIGGTHLYEFLEDYRVVTSLTLLRKS